MRLKGNLATPITAPAIPVPFEAMSNDESTNEESFMNNLLEYPQYTRPYEYEGLKVPDILLSGDHKKVAKWQLDQAIEITKKNRPDLYEKYLKDKV